MVVDYRSLIEFCRSFDHRRSMTKPPPPPQPADHRTGCRRRTKSLNPLSHPFCEHSPLAAIDIIILFLALIALAVLALPYLSYLFRGASVLLPMTLEAIGDVICDAPVAYAAGLVLMLVVTVAAVVAWEVFDHRSRRCGRPNCRGLLKAIEFDIQLESEECVKYLPAVAQEKTMGVPEMEIGKDQRELEAELKKMAPINGRTVLIFRAPCGCPTGRMAVWGMKKGRRLKK